MDEPRQPEPALTGDIELISDGDGIAVIGQQGVVDAFLTSEGLVSRDLGLRRLSSLFRAGSATAQAGGELAANTGRWIKLTEESAKALEKFDTMKGSSDGLSRAVLTHKGKTKHILEFASKPGVKSMLTNPAVLAGAAGIMAQVAMQQTMDEITDYLAAIDAKVDDILRAHKDAVVADMLGVDLVVQEAMTIREHTGGVSEVTWSKVQATNFTIARTQVYALSQLDALAAKVEAKPKVGDLAGVAQEADAVVRDWLAVLARCFQLEDAIAVLELDRVMAAQPDQVEQHRKGLNAARQNRRAVIARTTRGLVERMGSAAAIANANVLLHPRASATVVKSGISVVISVADFHEVLGVDGASPGLEARRWLTAATEARDRAFALGADGVAAARRRGGGTVTGVRSVPGRVSEEWMARRPRAGTDDDKDE